MAQTQEMKHIQVNAHEDEVVIYAGHSADDASSKPSERADGVSHPVKAESQEEVPTQTPQQQVPKQDGYQATTLDDLISSKMSTTQKVIIVLAVLGILAFVLWYVILT